MMSLSSPFIARPVATTLLTLGVLLAGIMAFMSLPVAPLPKVDFPTISVTASLPGASPDTVATSVTTPLERRLGAIAGVSEITSTSTVGNSRITLQFDLSRSIDGAARDVQAAINAARADLPTDLRSNPQYRKVNPADAPVLILALTSDTLGQGRLYDAASNVLQQKLSQVTGVGQVTLGGSSLPAVRVEINPTALNKYQIGLESVRAALAAANANTPKGAIEVSDQRWQLYTNDQSRTAAEYRPLIIAWRNGAPVRLSDVAEVIDATEDIRNEGQANGKRSVLVIIYLQPNANIIETVDEVKALLPDLQAALPNDVDLMIASDRTTTIRASLKEVERALTISVILVVLVTFAFLRSFRAGLVPSVAVPVSLVGTFGVMYLMGYSLNNLSLMAMTIAAGFVVDDAIIVLENIQRHIEEGMPRVQAALLGSREVGFTVISMSLSLIAVFIPILLMGGIVGRLFREFAVTLSIAILISMVISLTTTPMMCAFVLKPPRKKDEEGGETEKPPGWLARTSERAFTALQNGYGRTLRIVLNHPRLTMTVFLGTIILNIFLYVQIPKGFFPQQDTGRLVGGIRADQSISFQSMRRKFRQFVAIIREDPAIENVVGFTGGYQVNSGFLFATLKPLNERKETADQVIARLRPKLAQVPGANVFLQAVQDIRVGGRQGNSQYQFTLQSDSLPDLYAWGPKLVQALQRDTSVITDVDSDQQQRGLQVNLTIDRDAAARLGVSSRSISATLYDAFGQRQVSTIYNALNQYHVVMEVSPEYWENPESLKDIYVSTSGGAISGSQATAGHGDPERDLDHADHCGADRCRGDAARSQPGGAQPAHQCDRRQRPRLGLDRCRGQHIAGNHDSAVGRHQLRVRHHAARRQPPGPVRRQHRFLQPDGGQDAERRRGLRERHDARDRRAGHHPWLVPGHGARLPAVARQPDPGRAGRPGGDLYRARHAVRELHPSDHDPLDLALGRHRRAARAAARGNRVQHHRHDRRAAAGRHREEERDHDDRRGAGTRAPRKARAARGDLRSLPAALPADPDDDHGGDAGRAAAGAEFRRRRGAAPAARHIDHRRPAGQPGADALHHAGGLHLSRSLPPPRPRQP